MKHVSRAIVAVVLASTIWLMLQHHIGSDARLSPHHEDGVQVVTPDSPTRR